MWHRPQEGIGELMNIVAQQAPIRQVDIMLDHLRVHGSITGMESIKMGIMNYKGRIHDLRRSGYCIETKWESHTNKKGETKTYARYYLKGD